MRKYIHLFILISGLSLFACEKFLEPVPDTSRSEEQLMADMTFVEGLLMHAYAGMPVNYNFGIDVAASDAVTNLQGSSYTRMATGEWKSTYYPFSVWENSYDAIYHINLFLDRYKLIPWASSPKRSQSNIDSTTMFHIRRLTGEAYGLRAWYEYQLLQYHSGKAANGSLLGFPIILEPVSTTNDWKLPRDTFSECVRQIMSDLDTAIKYLPRIYTDTTGGTAAFKAVYNETMGVRYENRMSENAAMALKSRVALMAASPAFSQASGVTWAVAAKIAGGLAKNLGALYATGTTFYKEKTNKEIIWNRSVVQSRNWETANFPPSLFGLGNTNPSQTLVDAFPMKNGYPISQSTTPAYNPADPYANRDTRLSDYIIYNGSIFKSKKINTYIGADLDGINTLVSSTRTGYYLKKFMSESVSLVPLNTANAQHTYTFFRMTEVILNYAEAANEAYGPDADPNGTGFTARSKIGDLRKRAGITQPDNYLLSLDKDGLRELILNERRIELCFEGFRFWDIRRLNRLTEMNTPVSGVYITRETEAPDSFSYRYSNIEERIFSPYMIYGPVPYDETLKYDITQNEGW